MRFGGIRRTISGAYEERLPACFWILPEVSCQLEQLLVISKEKLRECLWILPEGSCPMEQLLVTCKEKLLELWILPEVVACWRNF